MTGRLSATVAVILAALAITGCSSQVALKDPALPEPLLTELPLTVAVRYSPEMSRYVHTEEVLGRQKWTINLGAANKLAFRHLFDSMFREVIEVGEDTDAGALGADALIEASIEAFEFALPAQSRSDAYTIWIRYRLRIFDAEGVEISNWPIAAYGKAGSEGLFSADQALARAAVLAMRDAAAMIGMRFARETGLGDPGREPGPAGSLNALTEPAGEAEAGAVTVVAPPQAAPKPASEAAAAGDETTDESMDEAVDSEPRTGQSADVAANTGETSQGNFTDDRG